MYQHIFDDSQFSLDNIIRDDSEVYLKENFFSKFYDVQCESDPLKQTEKDDQNSGQLIIGCPQDYENYIDKSIQKTQFEDPASEIFRQDDSSSHKKQGSTNCQNSPKLISKVLSQIFTKSSSKHGFSDQASQYAKYGIKKLKKSPTINTLAQVFIQTPTELEQQRKISANSCKFDFSLDELDIKNYQLEFRAFVVQRRQQCLQMAAKRQIKDNDRLICFIKYVDSFIVNLERGVVKGKLKKF